MTRSLLALLFVASAIARPDVAAAADQTILGRTFVVSNPDPGGDPSRRKIVVLAREDGSPNTIVGDPMASGVTFDVIANGATSTSQTFTVPPGVAASHGAGWRATSTGWMYRDATGTNGPVHTLVIKRTTSGQFTLKVVIYGRQGPEPQPRVVVVPPAPGTDGGLVLTINGGDTYCVAFGGAAGGSVQNLPSTGVPVGARTFKIMRPTSEPGCPTPATTTTTVTTSSTTSSVQVTTTSTTPTTVQHCGNGTLDPGEACDPPGSMTCPVSSPAGSFVACNADCTCGSTTSSTSTSSTSSTSTSVTTTTSTSRTTTTGVNSTSSTSSSSVTTTSHSTSTASSTSTTPPPSTTSTTVAGCPTRLAFTTTAGTTSCGGAALSPGAAAPFTGAIFSATTGGTKVADLGLSCLYVGGGGNTSTAPNGNPDGPTTVFGVNACNGSTLTLVGNAGSGRQDCSLAPFATKHCTRTPATACTDDTQCGGPGQCNPDARCFFGPPLPVPAGPTSTCLLNVFAADGGGTVDRTAGTSSITIPLSSRVYLTGNNKVCTNGAVGSNGFGLCTSDSNCGGTVGSCQAATACPRCINNTCIGGQNHGHTGCTPVGSKATALECPPQDTQFVGPLGVTLSPLGTGLSVLTSDASGNFCPSQRTAGAFGKSTARRIEETGSAAGNIADNASHPVTIAATFCIPATGNALVDGGTGADLPGPGGVSIRGTLQTLP